MGPEGIGLIERGEKPREACGVVGYFTLDPEVQVGQILYSAAYALQHRGEEGGGIVVYPYGGDRKGVKDTGLLKEVLPYEGQEIDWICADAVMGIGHTRYGTSGGSDSQPFWGEHLTLAHNGNIPNAEAVAMSLGVTAEAKRSVTDSEWVTKSLDLLMTSHTMDIHAALDYLLPFLDGAYCFTITDGKQLIAVRDPNGIRPLSLGYRLEDEGYMVASETPALAAANAVFMRDVEPGEILTIDRDGPRSRQIKRDVDERLCAFEFTYTARADSVLRGRGVKEARFDMGAQLATEVGQLEADMVLGMPDTAIDAAAGFSFASGIPLEMGGLKRDRYQIKRGFQHPTQELRELAAKRKYHLNEEVVRDKRVVIVDDSIVRGTTMNQFIDRLWKAGVKSVDLVITSPPISWPCFHGVDTGDPQELIANNMTITEMTQYFRVNSLHYLSLEGWKQAIGMKLGGLCVACVNGEYVVPVPEDRLAGVPVALR